MSLVAERRRVSLVLNSEPFRKELEDIVETFIRSTDSTGLNSSLLSLQHLTDLLSTVPGKRPMTGGGFTKSEVYFHFVHIYHIPYHRSMFGG